MKKISIAVISLVLSAFMFFSCAGSNSSAHFSLSLEEVRKTAESELDFGGAEFHLNTEDYAEDILMYQYGIEDTSMLDSIDSYLITTAGTNSAKTLAVIVFKDGVTEEAVSSVEETIKEVYITALINRTAMYDAAQCEIAEKASFIRYDNALAVVAYDNAGNSAATDVLFK